MRENIIPQTEWNVRLHLTEENELNFFPFLWENIFTLKENIFTWRENIFTFRVPQSENILPQIDRFYPYDPLFFCTPPKGKYNPFGGQYLPIDGSKVTFNGVIQLPSVNRTWLSTQTESDWGNPTRTPFEWSHFWTFFEQNYPTITTP